MNRLELVDRIRAKDQFDALPTIMTTSCGNKKDIVATIEAGVDNYVTKTVPPDELQDNIAKACKSAAVKDPLKCSAPRSRSLTAIDYNSYLRRGVSDVAVNAHTAYFANTSRSISIPKPGSCGTAT